MHKEEFKWVISSSLKYPFQRFSEIKNLVIATTIGYVLLSVLQVHTHISLGHSEQLGDVHQLAQLGYGILAILLAIPLSVAVLRNVILQEVAQAQPLTQTLNNRLIWFLAALIKVSLVALFATLISVGSIASALYLGWQNFVGPSALVAKVIGGVAVMIAFLLYLSLFLRLGFALVHAALDKSSRLSDSWRLTRGYFGLILISILTIALTMFGLSMVYALVAAGIVYPLWGWLGNNVVYIIGLLYAFVYPFLTLFQMSVMGYLYLAMKPQKEAQRETSNTSNVSP